MKVVSSDDDGTLDLQLLDDAVKDSAADLDEASEWAFLVNVLSFNSFTWSLESKTHISGVPLSRVLNLLSSIFSIQKDCWLLLKRPLCLQDKNL